MLTFKVKTLAAKSKSRPLLNPHLNKTCRCAAGKKLKSWRFGYEDFKTMEFLNIGSFLDQVIAVVVKGASKRSHFFVFFMLLSRCVILVL